jgi:putative ATP-dependent endonuclease of OLD family
MGILIDKVRIFGFRSLKNVEVDLSSITILTGMNNSGKTSFLKAIQLALGNKQFLSYDDFNIQDNTTVDKIIIDLRIVPINALGKRINTFSDDWEILFTVDRIITNSEGEQFVPLRTLTQYDNQKNSYKSRQFILQDWFPFKDDDGRQWFENEDGIEKPFYFDQLPFFIIDAQRDIVDDMKTRSSYLGKMISKIEYSPSDVAKIEKQIDILNEKTVSSSKILSNIRETLKELNTALNSNNDGIEITPFTKKLRDLSKGLSIHYADNNDSFSMEYHGMGTRSWSSLLILKSFINMLAKNSEEISEAFFPIIALEEPEAHLHPNAQKKLYHQIENIAGQKIISTHSPYIAASAKLDQLRSFYKDDKNFSCGQIHINRLTKDDIRKIQRLVVNTRGEIFFSKIIVFFEGDTEEQALPILAEKFFNKTCIELGIDFFGVGGFGNYLPFIRVAESFNIPWFILSDAELSVKTSVIKQFSDCACQKQQIDTIFFVEDGIDFEKQLLRSNFASEIKNAIKSIELAKCSNDIHRRAKKKEIDRYDNDKLYKIMIDAKTTFGPIVAEEIAKSNKPLPEPVKKLFTKIKEILET